jgi:hypothetical protein
VARVLSAPLRLVLGVTLRLALWALVGVLWLASRRKSGAR